MEEKKITMTLSTMYPILFGMGLLVAVIGWLLYEPSIWSRGLKIYKQAYCTDMLTYQYKNIDNYDIERQFEIQQNAEMCINRRYVEEFDKSFKKYCVPNFVAKNITWIGIFVVLGNCGTFIFTLHKVSV